VFNSAIVPPQSRDLNQIQSTLCSFTVIISVYYMLEGFEIYRMYFFYKPWGLSFHLESGLHLDM